MTVTAANPEVLPRTDLGSKLRIAKPNKIGLTANQWEAVPVALPSIFLVTTASAATVIAVPDQVSGDPSVQGEVYTAIKLSDTSYLFYFHAPGRWKVRSTVAGSGVLIDTYDGILPILLMLRAVGITGGASGLVADVGNTDADADFQAINNALSVRANLAGVDLNVTGNWRRISALVGATWDAVSPNGYNAMAAAALMYGRDISGGGAGLARLIEARAYSGFSGAAATIQALATMAIQQSYGVVDGTLNSVTSLREITGVSNSALAALAMRDRGFWGGIRGRRFTLCLPATVVAQSGSSFSATAPVLLFVAPATNEWIVRRVRIHWYDPITVATTRVRFVTDPDNRYSSGGVSMIPTGGFKSTTRGSAGAALTPTQARYNDGITAIVATAADDDEFHYGDLAAEDNEGELIWTPDDEIIVPPSGSLLGYVWDGGGTEFTVQVEIESANVE